MTASGWRIRVTAKIDHREALRAAPATQNQPIHAGMFGDGWGRMRIPSQKRYPATAIISTLTHRTRIHRPAVIPRKRSSHLGSAYGFCGSVRCDRLRSRKTSAIAIIAISPPTSMIAVVNPASRPIRRKTVNSKTVISASATTRLADVSTLYVAPCHPGRFDGRPDVSAVTERAHASTAYAARARVLVLLAFVKMLAL